MLEVLVEKCEVSSFLLMMINTVDEKVRVLPNLELGKTLMVDMKMLIRFEEERIIVRNKSTKINENELVLPEELKGKLSELLTDNDNCEFCE